MADDVIKNPLRSMPRPQVPYEPEHVRQGINVQPAPTGPVSPTPAVVSSSRKPLAESETWASLDGETLDDDGNVIPFDNGHIIDNNDFVNLGYDSTPRRADAPTPAPTAAPEPAVPEGAAPQVGDYILMVMGKLITSGNMEKIQSRVKSIVYGEDPAFAILEISIDDIVVLKRVNIKVGIFIDG